MEKFSYVNATSLEQVTALLSDSGWGEVMLIAGGTDLLAELKEYVETPKTLVNLKTLPGMDAINADASGLTIGALTTVADIARHPTIQQHYTVLAQAAGSVATPQIRNVGTLGGNLCQRPRCWYYRDESTHCLKKGGDICYAVDGLSKYHAILGGDPVYIVHPSDIAPALIALGASVKIVGPEGEKTMALEDFFTLPAANPFRENVLEPNEIVVEVQVPPAKPNTKSFYLLVWVLAESHLVLHLWPERGYATADLHVCDYRVSNADRARQACRVLSTLCFAPGSDHWNEMAVGGRESEEDADNALPEAIAGLDGKQTSLCSATITEEVSVIVTP